MPAKNTLHRIFCANLRQLRDLSGMTQVQVAEIMGVSQPAYSSLEGGRNCPSLDTVEDAAKAFQTTAPLLLTPGAFDPKKNIRRAIVARG